MNLAQMTHHGDGTEDACTAESPSSEPSDLCDVFGEPEILPRIGYQYQVDIPTLSKESDYFEIMSYPTDAATEAGAPHCFLIGLPVPIMWLKEEVDHIKHGNPGLLGTSKRNWPVESDEIKEDHVLIKREGPELKIEPSEVSMEIELCVGRSMSLDLRLAVEKEMHKKCEDKGRYAAPGSLSDSWSDIEKAGFLLGLYIFGKNLVQVKRFIESKNMGDLLSFYYGEFYKSAEYRRWAGCRKMRSRKCIFGQRIFTGLRQQELLSRLLPHLSEDRQNILLEVSKAFGEGKILLEEYVSALKAAVGMNVFIEAVGIGKGKQDLTGIALEPLKHNQVVPARPEMPIGKACSSLTTQEIVKCLTGDFRLSKARSSDLFWEAVWPRLLARGWHSEQPRGNNSYVVGSKLPLVFLVPGVKKFSRRKLAKGSHYFDSVSDVLSMVASDPALLEFETEADEGNRGKEESGLTNETKPDKDNVSDRQHHCYLQPRTPNRNADVVKFTVVDTSLGNGAKYKEKELRSLPFESSITSTSSSHSEEINEDTSEEPMEESNSAYNMFLNHEETNRSDPARIIRERAVGSGSIDSEISVVNLGIIPINDPHYSTSVSARVSKRQNASICDVKKPSKSIPQLGRKMKPETSNYLAHVSKRRRRLTACSRTETSLSTTISSSVNPGLKQGEPGGGMGRHDSAEDIHCEVVPLTDMLCSSSSSCKGSTTDGGEGMLSSNCSGSEHPRGELQSRTMIDLNLPVLPDAEISESVILASSERSERQDDRGSKLGDLPNPLETSTGVANSEQPANMISRRQSTRNRPLTTKALEALASGFLCTTKRRRKRTDAFPEEDLISRPSRRARCKMTESFDNGIIDLKKVQEGNGVCNDNGDMFSKFHIRSEGEGAQVSGP